MSLADKLLAMAAAAVPPVLQASPRWWQLQGQAADLTTPLLSVPLTTVAGAVLGSFAAIAYDEVARPRGKLLALAFGTTVIASALVGVVPAWLGWKWTSGNVAAGLAALAAVVTYYGLPPAIKRGGEIIRAFSFSDLIPGRKAAPTPPAVGGPEDSK